MQPDREQLEREARAGVQALQAGRLGEAREHLDRVARSGSATPQLWLFLAQACVGLDDKERAHEALDQVLAAEPRGIYPLLMKGELLANAGDDRAAVSYFRMALSSAASASNISPDLESRLRSAEEAVGRIERKFEDHLAGQLTEAGISRIPPRLAQALDIANGKREVFLQQPTSFYYPELPNIAWYDPGEFPWTGELEAHAAEIRAEAEAVLEAGSGIAPYVEPDPGRPSRGHSLLGDERWSAFYLWRNGEPVAENAARCPVTMAMLERPPIPRIARRSPMALISILRPGTHIPPHTGMLNTRLICHVPLIVPDGCRLRVGGETRDVQPGKMMIFDDSIEHEAWNDGTAVRAVLLFEIWRPELDEEERKALTLMFESIGAYPSAGH